MHEAKQVWSFLSMCETRSLPPDAFDECSFFFKKINKYINKYVLHIFYHSVSLRVIRRKKLSVKWREKALFLNTKYPCKMLLFVPSVQAKSLSAHFY